MVVLYPLYFDANRSREAGRRVPRSLAVKNPTLAELQEAAKRAGHRVEVEEAVAHPSRAWEAEGRVLIVGGGKKTEIIQAVAEALKAQRS